MQILVGGFSVQNNASNPSTPWTDQHLISPYNIIPETHIKVVSVKDMITYKSNSWLLNRFFLSAS